MTQATDLQLGHADVRATDASFPLRVRRLTANAVVPSRANQHDAGLDLSSTESLTLAPGARATVGTGLAIEVPPGWAALICPRSGLAAHHGIGVVNGPGVVDAGYRGEVRVVLHNSDASEPFAIASGDRIAQLVLVPVGVGEVVEVDELGPAVRDVGAFGSSGGFGSAPIDAPGGAT